VTQPPGPPAPPSPSPSSALALDPASRRRVSLQTGAIAIAAVLPGLATWIASPVIDGYPYLASALFGIGAMVGVWRLLEKYPQLRDKTRFLDPWMAASGAGYVLFLIGPSWGMALGILANRVLDRSAPVPHPSTVLSLKRSHKGPDSIYLASWRKSSAQLSVPLRLGTPLRALHDRGMGPGDNVVITTRKGALGFEYIVDAQLPTVPTVPTASPAAAGAAPEGK
jgi:hypothetical protein